MNAHRCTQLPQGVSLNFLCMEGIYMQALAKLHINAHLYAIQLP